VAHHFERRVAEYLLKPQRVAHFFHQVGRCEGVPQKMSMEARDTDRAAGALDDEVQAGWRQRAARG